MKRTLITAAALLSLAGGLAVAEDKTKPVVGVTVVELDVIHTGWSVKKDLLGKDVQNDLKEKIGKIEDLIVIPDSSISYAIVGVGGFLGMGQRNVAIPTRQMKVRGDALILPGANKDVLKEMPEFEYVQKKAPTN